MTNTEQKRPIAMQEPFFWISRQEISKQVDEILSALNQRSGVDEALSRASCLLAQILSGLLPAHSGVYLRLDGSVCNSAANKLRVDLQCAVRTLQAGQEEYARLVLLAIQQDLRGRGTDETSPHTGRENSSTSRSHGLETA